MRSEYLLTQATASAVIGWLTAKLGVMFWPLAILLILMIIDYITGMLASKAEALQHPEDPSFGWSSRRGILGILKKTGYMCIIAVSVCLDQIILTGVAQMGLESPVKGLFGLIVTVWLVLTEMISIIENAGRMGAPVPRWLARYIAVLKGRIDEDMDPGEEAAGDE